MDGIPILFDGLTEGQEFGWICREFVSLFLGNYTLRSEKLGTSSTFSLAYILVSQDPVPIYASQLRRAVSRRKRPSGKRWDLLSPNGFVIHVLLLTKHVTCVPSIFCSLGTIWIALDPLPTTPTRLFLKS